LILTTVRVHAAKLDDARLLIGLPR
jgi:hypothetical protein